MTETYIGIDLGTTTTLIARAQEDADNKISVKVLPIRQNNGSGKERELHYLPSLAYLKEDGELVVGLEAQNRGSENPSRLVRAVKRQMGRRILLPGINKRPFEISAAYLNKVLQEGKNQFPRDKIIFTVTVPTSFTSNQRADTLRALNIACDESGIPYPEKGDGSLFISEPVAAMLAFLNKEFGLPKEVRKLDFEKEHRIVVYDVGGGTLDLTIVYFEPKNKEQSVQKLADLEIIVEEISKYNPFGGEDFDLKLAEELSKRLMEKFPELRETVLMPRQRAGVRLQLMNFAKEIKEAMSPLIEEQSGDLFGDVEDTYYYKQEEKPIMIAGKPYSLEGELTIADYRDIVRDLTDLNSASQKNLIAPLRDFLSKTGFAPQALSGILIVGGMAQLPLVKEAIEEYWKSDDKVWMFNPSDHAVVAGAAVYSCLRQKYPEFSLEEKAADAYYVWLEQNGEFDLILPSSNKDAGKIEKYILASTSKRLRIEIFAGEDSKHQPIETSLIYQGRLSVDLKKTYNEGDPVWIQMLYTNKDKQDHTKVPWVNVWLKDPANQEMPDFEKRYTEITQETEDEKDI